jgi:hypothetical protein
MPSTTLHFIAAPLVLVSLAVVAAAGEPAVCNSEASILQAFRGFGERVEQLTNVQKGLAAEIETALEEASRTHGWPSAHKRQVVEAFFASPEYHATEEAKAPLGTTIQEHQAALRAAKTMVQAEEVCRSTPAALKAVEARFAINVRQYELLRQRIKDAQ